MGEFWILAVMACAMTLLKFSEHRLCASKKGKWLCWHAFKDTDNSGEERECIKCEHRYVTSLAEY